MSFRLRLTHCLGNGTIHIARIFVSIICNFICVVYDKANKLGIKQMIYFYFKFLILSAKIWIFNNNIFLIISISKLVWKLVEWGCGYHSISILIGRCTQQFHICFNFIHFSSIDIFWQVDIEHSIEIHNVTWNWKWRDVSDHWTYNQNMFLVRHASAIRATSGLILFSWAIFSIVHSFGFVWCLLMKFMAWSNETLPGRTCSVSL